MTYFDRLEGLFLAVVPEAVINPEAEKLQWRLGAEVVHSGHVEIIEENKHVLPTHRHIYTFNPLLHSRLNDLLNIIRASLKENNIIIVKRKMPARKHK